MQWKSSWYVLLRPLKSIASLALSWGLQTSIPSCLVFTRLSQGHFKLKISKNKLITSHPLKQPSILFVLPSFSSWKLEVRSDSSSSSWLTFNHLPRPAAFLASSHTLPPVPKCTALRSLARTQNIFILYSLSPHFPVIKLDSNYLN